MPPVLRSREDGPGTAGHGRDVAVRFARAFHSDPCFAHVFPDPDRREARLRTMFGPVVRAAERAGGVVTEKEPAAREIAADVRAETAYLWVVGVEPAGQGTGAGGRVVRRTLAAMEAAGHRRCVLKTENPANRSFYVHLGFREEREIRAPSGLPVWIFSRVLER